MAEPTAARGAPPPAAAPAARDRETAAARWNARTWAAVGRSEKRGPLYTARAFALVSVAQYNAVIAAENAKARGRHPSEAGAVAAAAAAMLAGLYPAEQGFVATQLALDAAYFPGLPSERDADWAAGVAVGRVVAQAVLNYAAKDRSAAVSAEVFPTGPTLPAVWYSAPPPAVPGTPLWGQVQPWLLTSPSQFRPAAPPAIGSDVYNTDLDEVRRYASLPPTDPVRAEQRRIAFLWHYGPPAPGSTLERYIAVPGWSTMGFFGSLAADRIARQHLDERRAARVFAVMYMAVMDASIGCYDAKYHYRYFRPSQADPTIVTAVPLPNFPAYPSAHSCLTSALVGALGGMFPQAADDLRPFVDEAGEARIYAGLHFRFDVVVGRTLGEAVAANTLRLAPRGHEPIRLPID